jgi:hypothetical protein
MAWDELHFVPEGICFCACLSKFTCTVCELTGPLYICCNGPEGTATPLVGAQGPGTSRSVWDMLSPRAVKSNFRETGVGLPLAPTYFNHWLF